MPRERALQEGTVRHKANTEVPSAVDRANPMLLFPLGRNTSTTRSNKREISLKPIGTVNTEGDLIQKSTLKERRTKEKPI